MQSNSNCIREASKACFNSCCANPLLPNPSPPSTATAAATPRRDFVSAILSTLDRNTTFTNHESLPSSKELLQTLSNAVPNFLNTVLADSIRAQHYHHFRRSGHVCLDYVGHGLFSYSQKSDPEAPSTSTAPAADATDRFFEFEQSPASFTSYLLHGGDQSEFHSAAKRRIFKYMNLPEDDYSLVFTANQPSAFKILGQSYPFHTHQNLVTVYDHENEAAEAIADAARKGGGVAQSAVFSWPSLRVNSTKLRKTLAGKKNKSHRRRGLFAFPLQSRMSGARYSYQWMNMARENGWHVLLDATALSPKEMETLGLSLFHPDFLISSFFNIYGENPSGFCCILVKKSSAAILTQSSAAIGVITLLSPNPIKSLYLDAAEARRGEITVAEAHDAVEFRGLDHADTLGLILISARLRCLVNWAVNALVSLRHPHSGNPLVGLYGPRIRVDRGPALAFNVFDWKGERVEPALVQKLADRSNISLSVGLLKNVCFSHEEAAVLQREERRRKKKREEGGVGVVSAALGMLSDFQDVYRLWAFVARFLDADFVEKEKWRYTALNQSTVEV